MSQTKVVPDSFVHLHNHSDYSLLDGAMKTKKMVERAAGDGMPALALTDHGNMFGAVEFYQNCRKGGIKPIIGTEAYIAADRHDRSTERAKINNHLVLLARNEAGWRNLIKLSSKAYLEGFYYKPRIDKELLARHSEGLIGLSACMSGEPNRHLVSGDVEAAVKAAGEYRDIFGRDNYYLEIQNHGLPEEERIRQLMPEVAKQTGLGIVATNDCHFLDRDHFQAHDILLCIGTNRLVEEEHRWKSATPEVYFKKTREMLELFHDWPDAIANTLRIADRCDFDLELGHLLLPEFPLPDRFETPDDYLEHLAREGLQKRYERVTPELEERLAYELGIIRTTGYAGYFLIVWDFIAAARRLDIPVGPGRGSAAGSLVCYSVRITDIDPMSNGLIFERFLNPERISMPDIDVDFCMEKRGKIIEYVEKTYGSENVSQIITFGTMAARGVVKDVGRVLGLNFQEADRIAKLVPEEIGITLDKALAEAPGLAEVRRESPRNDLLISNALVLEGLCRNPGIHAAGVLITPSPLVEHAPLYRSSKGDVTVQFDMKCSEQLGLLKMDFLGLRTLTVIDKALRLIGKNTGETIVAEDIPMDDEVTFALLREGRTVGVFQLESSGMQELVAKMAPTCFGDITALNALYRPGPLGANMDEVFVECKHGRRQVKYKDPCLEPILEETYGVILYQEQVMRIASIMGGFTMGQADTLRKAMGKKKKEIMAEMKVLFIDGAREKGFDARVAEEVFDEMAFFAAYGFNKSHSASYAMVSLQTAWLKAHHPAEFMAATMSTEMRKSDRVTVLIDEVKRLGLDITPPDIDRPGFEFGAVRDRIIFGMGAVKGVGEKAIEEIVETRERLGRDFTDLFDLCENLDLQKVNRKVLEGLIHAGALDALPGHRAQLVANLDPAIAHGQKTARDRQRGQDSLFGDVASEQGLAPQLAPAEPYDALDELSLERKAVGFFLSGHPFHEYRELMATLPVSRTTRLAGMPENAWIDLAGVVTSFSEARDKHKRLYARAHFEDRDGMCEVVVYSRLYEEVSEIVAGDSILVVGGRVQVRSDGKRGVVADRITVIDDVLRDWTAGVKLDLDLEEADPDELDAALSENSAVAPEDDEGVLQACRRVPLLIETERLGEKWLLRARGSGVHLDLETLRRLRRMRGCRAVAFRSRIPSAPAAKPRGQWRQRGAGA